MQFFPGFGIFKGRVVDFDKVSGLYSVTYDDGDEEDLTAKELKLILAPESKKVKRSSTSADDAVDRKFEKGTLVEKVCN
jgi:Lamin-B receptor of TUDOR domain